MVDLGWAGMAIPEVYGGFEFGYSGLGIVLEETGRTLVPTPLVSTILLSATAINLAGSDAQKTTLLPAIAAGESIVAFALEEGAFHNPAHVSLSAVKTAEGYELNGVKKFVLDAAAADHFVVVAFDFVEVVGLSSCHCAICAINVQLIQVRISRRYNV
jgi:acyl-CoA dehydrogenase